MFLSRGPFDFGDSEVTHFPGSRLFVACHVCESRRTAGSSISYKRLALGDRAFSGHDRKATCLSHGAAVLWDLRWKCQATPSLAVRGALLNTMVLIGVCMRMCVRLQIAW